MTTEELKSIVKCFARWLDTPDAKDALSVKATFREATLEEWRAAVEEGDPLPVPVPQADVSFGAVVRPGLPPAQPGFASLLTGESVAVQDEFRAMVNGKYQRVRMIGRSGGVLQVRAVRTDGSIYMSIVQSLEQVHPEDRAVAAKLFSQA